MPDYLAGLRPDALAGTRIGVISSNERVYQAAVAAVQAAGRRHRADPDADRLGRPARSSPTSSSATSTPTSAGCRRTRRSGSLTEVIAFNTAHPDEAIKLGMDILIASEAIDLDDPATKAVRDRPRDRAGPRRAATSTRC